MIVYQRKESVKEHGREFNVRFQRKTPVGDAMNVKMQRQTA